MMTDEADPGDPRHGFRVPRRSVLGYGGGVDVAVCNPWSVVGRYGWVGRTDTSGDVVPSDNSNAVLLTLVKLGRPGGAAVLESFWAAAKLGHNT